MKLLITQALYRFRKRHAFGERAESGLPIQLASEEAELDNLRMCSNVTGSI